MTTTSPVNVIPQVTADQIDKAARYFVQTRNALVESTAGLTGPQWDFKPSAGRWSVGEIVEHVILIETLVHGIIGSMPDAPEAATDWKETQMDERILNEVPNRTTKLQAPPQARPTHGWNRAQALERFLQARERSVELLSAPALRGHVRPHPVFGPWDGYHWLIAAAGHSARHTDQILEVKADPGFPEA